MNIRHVLGKIISPLKICVTTMQQTTYAYLNYHDLKLMHSCFWLHGIHMRRLSADNHEADNARCYFSASYAHNQQKPTGSSHSAEEVRLYRKRTHPGQACYEARHHLRAVKHALGLQVVRLQAERQETRIRKARRRH